MTGGRIWDAAFVAAANVGRVHPGGWDYAFVVLLGDRESIRGPGRAAGRGRTDRGRVAARCDAEGLDRRSGLSRSAMLLAALVVLDRGATAPVAGRGDLLRHWFWPRGRPAWRHPLSRPDSIPGDRRSMRPCGSTWPRSSAWRCCSPGRVPAPGSTTRSRRPSSPRRWPPAACRAPSDTRTPLAGVPCRRSLASLAVLASSLYGVREAERRDRSANGPASS